MTRWVTAWWREALLVALIATVMVGFHGGYGLFDVDEAVFTQATREMADSGVWSMPTYNGQPRFQKPPLIYWLQAGFMQLLGADSLWAARLPSALFGLASVLLLGWSTWRLTRNRTWAVWAMAALGVNISFVVVSRAATADAVMNFFALALVLWCLRVVYLPPWRFSWLVTGLLVALGLLAKGPITAVPAALVVVPLLLARPDRANLWQRLAPFKVMAWALLLLLPWLVLLWHDDLLVGFFSQFVMDENLHRFGAGLSNTHSGSPLYYLLVVALGFMPWVFVLPAAIMVARRTPLAKLHSTDVRVALPYLALVWAAGIVGLFMLSGTKLAHYVVPAYPALALLVGAWAAGIGMERKNRSTLPYTGMWVLLQTALVAAVMVLLPSALLGLRTPHLAGWLGWLQEFTAFAWPPTDILTREVLALPVHVPWLPFMLAAAGLVIAAGGYGLAVASHPSGRKWAMPAMAGGMATFLLVVVTTIVPLVWAYTQAPLARMAARVAAMPTTTPVIHLGIHKPSVLYLSQRPFTKLEKPLQLPATVPAGTATVVLTEQTEVAGIGNEMGRIARVEVLACDGGYCLLEITRILP